MTSRWSERWRRLLADHYPAAAGQLQRGRSYQRSGRVTDVRAGTGVLSGRVQGIRATPYLVEVGMPVLDDAVWDRVVTTLAGQVRHSARLLAGQAPEGLDDQLEAAGLRLFPAVEELQPRCACADPLLPCVHLAALWEAVAERLDDDPFVLLRLRGRGRERLLAALPAARRSTMAGRPPGRVRLDTLDPARGEPVDGGRAPVASWTRARASLDDVDVAAGVAPRTPAAPLRLLGDPPGWSGGVSAWELFRPLVEGAAAWARELGGDAEGGPGGQRR